MIVFGVACFNFGIRFDREIKLSASGYTTLLEKSLYEIDHIERNSVTIEYDDTLSSEYDFSEPPELLSNGGGFPLPAYFKLRFDVRIPKHIQDDINKESGFCLDIEKPIRVLIISTYYGPICFLSTESDLIDDGSDLVILIREYLKRYFTSKRVYFEFLGPSPFHADFAISVSKERTEFDCTFDDNGFLCIATPTRGYDKVLFEYKKDFFNTDEEAFNKLIRCLEPEISIFYLLTSLRVQAMKQWEKVDQLYKELIAKTSKYDLYSRVKSILNPHSRLIHQLLHELTLFEIEAFNRTSFIKSSYDDVYQKGLPIYLRSAVDKEYKEATEEYPTKHIVYFIEFCEKRFSQIWQTSILAVSALVGAVIGAVLTSLTSKGS